MERIRDERHHQEGVGGRRDSPGCPTDDMIKEENALVITFETGTSAFEAEKYAMRNGIKAQLISMPGELQAGCGMALKAPASCKDSLPEGLKKEGIAFDQAIVMKI